MPSLRTGYCIIISATTFFVLGSYATLLGAFFPQTGMPVSQLPTYCRCLSRIYRGRVWAPQIFDLLAADTHYKYFFLFLIPTTAYFVIANWVGWQYYRNS